MRITKYQTRLNKDKLNILVKEQSVNYQVEKINSARAQVDLVCDIYSLHEMAEEHFYLIALNTRCKVLGVFEISHGTVKQCFCGTREIFIRLLLCGASCFTVLHNHPSGEVSPSKEDFAATETIKKASKLMGIEFLDHLIVGENRAYYSFNEKNIL